MRKLLQRLLSKPFAIKMAIKVMEYSYRAKTLLQRCIPVTKKSSHFSEYKK